MKKKVLIIVCVLLVIACAVSALTISYAYYRQSFSGWRQTITATSISFRLNGEPIETVTNYDLGLIARGKEADIQLDVIVTASYSRNSLAQYTLDVAFAQNSELAEVIELFSFENGEFVSMGMLSQLTSFSDQAPINTMVSRFFKLVYSPSANDYYENKSFEMTLTASSSIVETPGSTYFVYDEEGLIELSEMGDAISGSKIVLAKDVEIATQTPIQFSYPVDFDLAGNQLSLAQGSSIVISYAGKQNVRLLNDNKSVDGIVGEGSLIYNLPQTAENGSVVYVSDNLSPYYSKIDVNYASFDEITNAIEAQIDVIEGDILVKDEKFDFCKNLKYYFSTDYDPSERLSIVPPQLGGGDDTSIVTSVNANKTAYIISSEYNIPLTHVNKVSFALAGQGGESSVVFAELKVRGVTPQALAQYMLDSLPDVINGSVFLAGYDQSTLSTIDWVSTDTSLLDISGKYLSSGYQSLTSWKNTTVTIGVIVDSQGVQARAYKDVVIEVLNAEQRTDLIYNYQQIILNEVGSLADIYDLYVNYEGAQKAGLVGIEGTIVNPAQNLSTGGFNFIALNDGENGLVIEVLNKPNIDRSAIIEIELTFIYSNSELDDPSQYISYSLHKTVTVVGYMSATELSDPTRYMQQDFDVNDYVLGNSYVYTVKASTPQGAKVDYEIAQSDSSYMFVENDIYQADESGNYVLINNEYVFFDTLYVYENGEYTASNGGTYILYNENYVNIATQLAQEERYERLSRITILPARVPSVPTTTATIHAYIWDQKDEFGEKIYFTDENNQRISYLLTQVIYGIYHNIPSEIESYSLYALLKEYFDLNQDGWIGIREASTVWIENDVEKLAKPLSTQIVSDVTYKYIDCSDAVITSLKGIEYFTNALGFDFSSNRIINLSNLSQLYDLNYLDLGDNLVADVVDLQYLDNLQILSLRNNLVTGLEPLRYLPSVRKLDLYHNEEINSFDSLEDYNQLVYLDIRQANRRASVSYDTTYYLCLVYDNNRSNGITVYRDGSAAWVPLDAEIVGAKALSEMNVIYEAYKTLNVPNSYYYEYQVRTTTYKKTFDIAWTTNAEDHTYLQFTTTGGKTTGYTIATPVVNRVLPITVMVTENGSATPVPMSKSFNLTLLQSQAVNDIAYIEITPSVFQLASLAVPDSVVCNFLFNVFNTTTTGYVGSRTGGALDGGDTTYLESSTISYAELTRAETNEYPDAFRNKGITSLAGLGYFNQAIRFPLDLRGNTLSEQDLEELSEMINVGEIKLSGGNYDFSKISSYSEVGDVSTITGLTGLTSLYVYGCYNLDDEQTLANLYQVYLANPNVNIYKDSDSAVWNPYDPMLEKYSQTLPSAFVFINLNDTVSYFQDGSNTYTFDFYGVKDITFTIALSDDNLVGYFTNLFTHTSTGVTYNSLAGYSDVVYDKVVLNGNDGRGALSVNHYVELKIDFNHKIRVVDYEYAEAGEYVGLDTIFPGRDLRASVLSRLSTLIASSVSKDNIGSIQNGYFSDGDYIYISMATIAGLSYNATLTLDGTYSDKRNGSAIEGLQYTSVTSVKISRDANLGDGRYLYHLNELIVAYSGVDFSDIRTDLPNMQVIKAGLVAGTVGSRVENNRYAILYDNTGVTPYYNLKHFPNLDNFTLVECNCYDFTGLTGLIGIDIAKLYIYATNTTNSSTNYSNKNNNTEATEIIVRSIYNNSQAATKDYRIGSPISLTDNSYIYTGTGWNDAILGTTELNQEVVKEYKELASYILDFGVELNGVKYYDMKDATIQNGQTIDLPSTTYYSNFGTTINDGDVGYSRRFLIKWKIYNMDAATVASMLGVSNLTAQNMSGSFANIKYCSLPVNTNNGAVIDRTLTVASAEYDYYFIIQGTIGESYLKEDNTEVSFGGAVSTYTFAYPVLILGTDTTAHSARIVYKENNAGSALYQDVTSPYVYNVTQGSAVTSYLSYRAFSDPSLRYAMFIATAIQPHNVLKPGIMYYYNNQNAGTSVGAVGLMRLSRLVASVNSITPFYLDNNAVGDVIVGQDTALSYSTFGSNRATVYISSLDGLGFLLALNELEIDNQYLSNLSGIAPLQAWDTRNVVIASSGTTSALAGLRSISANSNKLVDISALANISTLQTLSLNTNAIGTLNNGGTFVLDSAIDNLTKLDFGNNANIGAADFTLIKNSVVTNGSSALTELFINNTNCIDQASVLRDIATIENLCSSALSIKLGADSSVVITKSEIDAFFNDIESDAIMSQYVISGYQISNDFILTRTLTGKDYTLTLLNGANIINMQTGVALAKIRNVVGSQTTTKLVISLSGTQLSACYDIPLIDDGGALATGGSVVVDGVSRTYEDFDPALWLWLINNATERSGNLTYMAPLVSEDSNERYISITNEIGLSGLKGMSCITSLDNLTIRSQRYLSSLFTSSISGLKALTISNCPSLREQGMSGLRFATGLTTLNLVGLEGIDYKKTITYTDSNTVTTTTGKLILNNCTSIASFSINNQYNFDAYGDSNLYGALVSHYNKENYIFNYSSTDVGTNAKKLISYTKLDILGSSASGTARNLISVNSPLALFGYIFNGLTNYKSGNALLIASGSGNLYNNYYVRPVDYAAYFSTADSVARDIVPNTIYEDGIQSANGIVFQLPKTLYLGGVECYFDWSITVGTADYITTYQNGYALIINNSNYNDESTITLQYTLKKAGTNSNLISGEKAITIIPSDAVLYDSLVKQPPYFVEMPNGDGGTYLEVASKYFESTRFLFWLFNNSSVSLNAATVRITNANYLSLGVKISDVGCYYLSYSGRLLIETITLPNEGITSLSGIELFPNLKNFSIETGAVVSLEPLRFARLTTFSYHSRESSKTSLRNFLASDFSPLFNSRYTLDSFTYTGQAYPNIDDLSFLMGFGSQLLSINVGGAVDKTVQSYNNTLGFKYIVNWFYAHRPLTTIEYNGVRQIATDEDYLQAENVFTYFSATGTDVEYINDFEIVLRDSATQSGSSITANIPTIIDVGGSYYPIEWKTVSSFISVGDLVYSGQSFSVMLEGINTLIEEGDTVNEEELAVILATHTFQNILLTNRGYFRRSITIVDKDKNLLNLCYVKGRITIGQYQYEKFFVFNTSNANSFLQIKLDKGQGSMYMPMMWNINGYNGWSIKDNVGNKVSQYNGLEIITFSIGGKNAQVLFVDNPAIVSANTKLIATVEGTDIEYTLYHSFTASDKVNIMSSTANDSFAIEYRIAQKLAMSLAEYIAYVDARIDTLYATYEANQDASNLYSLSNFQSLTSIYNSAVNSIASALSKSAADTAYNSAFNAMAAVAKQYLVSYNKSVDGTGDAFDVAQYRDEGSTFTLPIDGAYTFTDAYGNAINGWLFGGAIHEFGDTVTMPSNPVIIAPAFGSVDYYLVKNTTTAIADFANVGHKLTRTPTVYNGNNYDYVLANMNFITASKLRGASGNTYSATTNTEANLCLFATEYCIISVNSLTNEVANDAVAIISSNTITERGLYTIYFSSSNATVESQKHTFMFSVMGNASAVGNGAWAKPDERFMLVYDEVNNFYYCTFTTTSQSAAPEIKLVAYYGTGFYALTIGGVQATGGNLALSKNKTYTVYFTPDSYAYSTAYVTVGGTDMYMGNGDDSIGFVGAKLAPITQISTADYGGVMIAEGDYDSTIDDALANYDGAQYQP